MRPRIFILLTIGFLTNGCKNQHKCLESPVNKLRQGQIEWFRPANELKTFITNKGDTVKSRMGNLEIIQKSLGQAPKECPHSPKIGENGSQQIVFDGIFSSDKIYLALNSYDADIPYFTYDGAEIVHLAMNDSINVRGKEYYNVIKRFRIYDDLSTIPDTIYFSKSEGLIKLMYLKNNLSIDKLN